jgi:hypothetical protein
MTSSRTESPRRSKLTSATSRRSRGRGAVLDWRSIKGNKATLLEGPYPVGHFVIGSGPGEQVILDFAELPDGNFIVDMIPHQPIRFHCEDYYNAFDRADVTAVTHYKSEKIIRHLQEPGIVHDERLRRADQWYFKRAIIKAANLKPYSELDDQRLRFGR